MLLADKWKYYELIDTGNKEKLERWGDYILRRPEPQAMWPNTRNEKVWANADAHYRRNQKGKGRWDYKSKIPQRWTVSYGNLSFYIEPAGSKHTGLFPEQAVNWEWMMKIIKSSSKPVRVLNLFAYTGGATVACACAGAEVCHVDAVKSTVAKAKENVLLSGLSDRTVRFITDDVIKFVQREKRRGKMYEGIIMDPPSYGRGPKGEQWKIENELYGLVELCTEILSPEPLFFLINSYTTGLAPSVLTNILTLTMTKRFGGHAYSDEIGLPVTSSGLVLPCGTSGRWESSA
ncbi:MAG: SAM-dependent methyltransferase [Clostridiaceae bacterium]|nr:SAM-dependent methyltransferase [Clostridiaceae bacterium]